ncbi:MAG: GNAT family N-acetyltransferase [Bacillota bacterium]|jgi:GNAT superfamily N-acetyltransferase
MLINIRCIQLDDRCRQFFRANWPQANREIFGWQEQERWQKEYGVVIAEEDGQILGAALFWRMGGVGYLSQLLVAAPRRRQGIGARLVAAFEEQCSACHKLALKTYRNSPSQVFYEKLGYQVEAVIEEDIHRIDWVYMRKGGRKNEGK